MPESRLIHEPQSLWRVNENLRSNVSNDVIHVPATSGFDSIKQELDIVENDGADAPDT